MTDNTQVGMLDTQQQQHLTDALTAILDDNRGRVGTELDALLVDNAPLEVVLVWALGFLDRATRDMFGERAEPSEDQVNSASRKAVTYFGEMFPDVTPGVMADTTEFALGRTRVLPAVISPQVCVHAALELSAWIMTMHGDAAGDRISAIIDSVAADLAAA